jgi:hypothetical protein
MTTTPKPLRRMISAIYHYVDGQKIYGPPSSLRGDASGLSGDVSDIPSSARPCNIADWVEEVAA